MNKVMFICLEPAQNSAGMYIRNTVKQSTEALQGLRYITQIGSDILQINFPQRSINNIRLTKSNCEEGKYLKFYDGDTQIGYATCSVQKGSRRKGSYPAEWFASTKDTEAVGKIKPYIYIDEFVMKDKIGAESYSKRKNQKKYGTMCMQKILEWAEKTGCDGRIMLDATKFRSEVNPARFYAKIGFESSPSEVDEIKRLSQTIKKQIEEIKISDLPEEEKAIAINDLTEILQRYRTVNGRYYNNKSGGIMYLKTPEALKDYPI